MTDLRTAAQQALEVLVRASSYYDTYAEIAALEAALAEPVQGPVATMTAREDMGADLKFNRPHTLQPGQQLHLYTAPPQRKPLTDDQLDDIAVAARRGNLYDLRIAIEKALGSHETQLGKRQGCA